VPSIGPLDKAAGQLPKEGAVIIVTASYEGQPPDNARKFVSWMDGLPVGALTGVKYAVFGVGNKDWARTYQAIPKKIDQKLADRGAIQLVERGEANARGDFFGDFDRWYADFWQQSAQPSGKKHGHSLPCLCSRSSSCKRCATR
jgi:cytochrome P450 / NADPH-cytochrome P450 reductase